MFAEPENETYLAPLSVAERLDVSTDTVRRWIKGGELPTVRIEGFVRVPSSDYRAFLRRKLRDVAQ